MAKIPKSMKLTRLVQEWLDEQKWDDEIKIIAENEASILTATWTIEEQECTLMIESREKAQRLAVFLYSPIIVPAKRYDEACKLANQINARSYLGDFLSRVALNRGGPFQIFTRIDLEGCTPTTQVITNMTNDAADLIHNWTDAMGQIVYTGKTADAIFEELDAKHDSVKPKRSVATHPPASRK